MTPVSSRRCSAAATLIINGQWRKLQTSRRRSLRVAFDLAQQMEPVLKLLQKYADTPMSLADACLVRMTEALSDSVILTTDADFRIYRRHSRQVVPCMMPD
ncbi:MAG: hypothetical protein M3544_14650 [Pseudomonadota bacterium]|nr:hypothetical protein [Pseudomonadota bacterium]